MTDSSGVSLSPRAQGGELADPRYRVAPAFQGVPDYDDELSLSELVIILRRRWLFVVVAAVLGVAAAFVFHSRRQVAFVAAAVLQIETPGQAAVGTVGQILAEGQSSGNSILSRLQLIESYGFLSGIVDELGLRLQQVEGDPAGRPTRAMIAGEAMPDTLDVLYSGDRVTVASRLTDVRATSAYGEPLEVGPVRLSFAAPEEAALEATFVITGRDVAIRNLSDALSTEIRPETNIVDVTATSTDPELARTIVNRVVERFAQVNEETNQTESQNRTTFIQEQIAEARTELDSTQTRLTDFRRREGIVSAAQLGAAEQSGLMDVDMQLEQLRADRQVFRDLLNQLVESQSVGGSGEIQRLMALPEVSSNPVFSQLYEQLRELQTERESLTSGPWGLSERNPTVIQLDQQLASSAQRLVDALESNLQNLDARFQALSQLRARTASRVAGRPEVQAEEDRLVAEVSAVRVRLEQLTEQLFLAQVAAAATEGPVQVIDYAVDGVPDSQAGLPVLLAVGLLLGVLSGSGIAVAAEQLDTRVRRAEDVEQALAAPTVGVIPQLREKSSKRRKLARKKVGSGSTGSPASFEALISPELVTLRDPRSSNSEAFRTLRTNVLYMENGPPRETLVVTSAMPSEGKTTITSNLAITFAQQGLRVLVVDADLRKPRLNNIFGVDRKPGFTEVLHGTVNALEAIRVHPVLEDLHIMPSGALPGNPSELIGSARMREVLRSLRESYDRVIIDTPPLAGGADAAILGAAADGVLLVVRAGGTEIGAVREARRQFETVGVRLIGGIFNDPSGEAERYGTYGYAYYYKYSYYGEDAT